MHRVLCTETSLEVHDIFQSRAHATLEGQLCKTSWSRRGDEQRRQHLLTPLQQSSRLKPSSHNPHPKQLKCLCLPPDTQLLSCLSWKTALTVPTLPRGLSSMTTVSRQVCCAGNVLLTSCPSAQNSFRAKISDFGLARNLSIQSKIETRTYGTITHMPLELLCDGILSKVGADPAHERHL